MAEPSLIAVTPPAIPFDILAEELRLQIFTAYFEQIPKQMSELDVDDNPTSNVTDAQLSQCLTSVMSVSKAFKRDAINAVNSKDCPPIVFTDGPRALRHFKIFLRFTEQHRLEPRIELNIRCKGSEWYARQLSPFSSALCHALIQASGLANCNTLHTQFAKFGRRGGSGGNFEQPTMFKFNGGYHIKDSFRYRRHFRRIGDSGGTVDLGFDCDRSSQGDSEYLNFRASGNLREIDWSGIDWCMLQYTKLITITLD